MSGLFKRLCQATSLAGFDPSVLVRNAQAAPRFVTDLLRYSRATVAPGFRIRLRNIRPILNEWSGEAGTLKGHYFHQDLWAARKIFERRPAEHIDIGSRIDGFVAHLMVFMQVRQVDIRPLKSGLRGLEFIQDDATDLGKFQDSSVDSLSSLHAAEHFGLGRYSDPIDPGACFRFMQALKRVLRPGGRLYFSVPVGRERVEFNAQRVFETKTILSNFSGLDLVSFSWVGDDGDLREDSEPLAVPPSEAACGLFEFTKARADFADQAPSPGAFDHAA
jgi:hypothetical protein